MKKTLLLFCWIFPLLALNSGGSITSNRYNDSLIGSSGSGGSVGPQGPVGPAGAQGPAGTFSSSYGQLNITSSTSILFGSVGMWIPVPFNQFNPSQNVGGSTSSPATITILETGVYEMTVSLYFTSEDSFEGPFTPATYTLGISTDGGTTKIPSTAVYASDAGGYSLNFSTISSFSANDTIQFYVMASALGMGGPFDNVFTLLGGHAYVMQIAE